MACIDELRGFGDLVADFPTQAAASLWQIHVGFLPRTYRHSVAGTCRIACWQRPRRRSIQCMHRRHHGPQPKAYPPNTDAREIREFRNTLRHHDVDRQRRELSELLDEGEVSEAGCA